MRHRYSVSTAIGITLPLALAAAAHAGANARYGAEPRPSYGGIADIDAEAEALRKSGVGKSFSRGWYSWDRFLCRYQDNGRKSPKDLKILRAVFLTVLVRHRADEQAQGVARRIETRAGDGGGVSVTIARQEGAADGVTITVQANGRWSVAR